MVDPSPADRVAREVAAALKAAWGAGMTAVVGPGKVKLHFVSGFPAIPHEAAPGREGGGSEPPLDGLTFSLTVAEEQAP